MGIKRKVTAIVLKTRKAVDQAHPASGHAGSVDSIPAVSVHIVNIHADGFVEVIQGFFLVSGPGSHNAHNAVRKRGIARGVFFVKVKIPDFFCKSKSPAKQELSQNQIRLL